MSRQQHWRVSGLCIMVFFLGLQACSVRPPAPIEDRASTPAAGGRSYRVQPGDTLYSIAWRYGLDYPRLAAANNIAPPFTIQVGERLALREADIPATPVRRVATAPEHAPVEPASVPSPRRPVADAPVSSAPASSAPVSPPEPPMRAATPPTDAAVGAWRWPAKGPVVRQFSPTLHKGIDVAGDEGDPIVAVAAGQIVYAGTGIPGYGELLIVRHNARYLSAYGHNDRLLVREGDRVIAGQQIATRGSSGTNAVKLHFEIREHGKPIDPMGLLPAR